MVAILVGCGGAAIVDDGSTIRSNRYEMASPRPPWRGFEGERSWNAERSYLREDRVYVRCPESHAIQVVEIGYRDWSHPSRRVFEGQSPFEQLVLDLYTYRKAVLGNSVKEVLSHKLTTVGERPAVEVETLSMSNRHGICPSEAGKDSAELKVKALVMDGGLRLVPWYWGWKRLVILSYSAPVETFGRFLAGVR